MSSAEVIGTAPYYFELPTGSLYTSEVCIEAVESEKSPRNLWQLYKMGKLLVLNTTHCDFIAEGGQPNDMRELSGLINDQQTAIDSRDYQRMRSADWADDDYVQAGQWLIAVLSGESPQQPLRRRQGIRAHYLGVFPSLHRITSPHHFNCLSQYNRSLGITPVYKRREYSDWSEERFARYVEIVFLTKDEKQTLSEALLEKAKADEGPSPYVIAEHIKKMGKKNLTQLLYDRGWFIGQREPQEYRDWGVRTMLVNGARDITHRKVIKPLHTRGRGPSSKPLRHHFDTVSDFKKLVRSVYVAKLQALDKDVASKRLPATLFEECPSDYEKVRRAAQYKLLNQLGVPMQDWHKKVAAGAPCSKTFMATIRQHSPHISEDRIKAVARKYKLYDDIWTLEEASEYLRVE